jgi:hypothetical protein
MYPDHFHTAIMMKGLVKKCHALIVLKLIHI